MISYSKDCTNAYQYMQNRFEINNRHRSTIDHQLQSFLMKVDEEIYKQYLKIHLIYQIFERSIEIISKKGNIDRTGRAAG